MSDNESSSDYSDAREHQLDREDYPYFSDEEFKAFSKNESFVVEMTHLSCKQRYEKSIRNFSLDPDKDRYQGTDLNIVLCGKTGSGKSSTANTILGRKAFLENSSSNSVTRVSLDNTCTYKNRRITVVDTPGIHDTGTDSATVAKELARIAFLLRDGVHCYIICMSASEPRFTKEVEEMLKKIKQKGTGNFLDYCMLAYTKAETEMQVCPLRKFLDKKKDNESNRCFLENIRERVVAVNNKSSIPAEALRNRDALIEMVDVVIADNRRNRNPVIFTNDSFKMIDTLHVKIASVVKEKKLHPILVNATIEAIVNSFASKVSFDIFKKEVIDILKKRQTSEQYSEIPFLITTADGTFKVHEKYVHQIKQLFDEIKLDVEKFVKGMINFAIAVASFMVPFLFFL